MKKGSRSVPFYSLIMLLNGAVAVVFGFLLIPPPIPMAVPDSPPVVARVVPAISGTPERIVISSLGIDLSVETGSYNPRTGGWTLSADKAYYADMSVPANDSNGVTLIYGHAQAQVFARLSALTPGTRVAVYTDNHRVFHYQYRSVKDVAPTDTSVFVASGPPTLVLQTCTGAWDAYRAMYSFAFVSEAQA